MHIFWFRFHDLDLGACTEVFANSALKAHLVRAAFNYCEDKLCRPLTVLGMNFSGDYSHQGFELMRDAISPDMTMDEFIGTYLHAQTESRSGSGLML